MPSRGTLSMRGLDDYLEKLAQAEIDVDAAADRALLAGGEIALAGMQKRAHELTGNLKRKLVKGPAQRDGNTHTVRIGLVGADADTARYGNAQEFGTASMAARPYIRPAMDEDKRMISAAMRDSLIQDGKL